MQWHLLYHKDSHGLQTVSYTHLDVYKRQEFGFVASGARKDRKFDSSLGGGALLDIGIYNLGFLHMIMGAAPELSLIHI